MTTLTNPTNTSDAAILATLASEPLRVVDQRVKLLKIATSDPHQFVTVTVSYNKGGTDYRKRGYSVTVDPITDKGDGFISYTLFKGGFLFLEEATRYGEKTLLKVAATATEHPKFREILAKVAGGSKLTLIGEWDDGLADATETARLASVAQGFAIQSGQVENCVNWIRNQKPQNESVFRNAVAALNASTNPKNLDEVPRGAVIERIAFKVGLEKSAQEFEEWLKAVSS